MIKLSVGSRILLSVNPVDFRKGIDGLKSLVRNDLSCLPQSGDIFGFINRQRTMLRFLIYDGSGYWVMTKRLSKGKFQWWPSGSNTKISPVGAKELSMMIRGLNPYLPG